MWQVMYRVIEKDDKGNIVTCWQDYGEPHESYRDAINALDEFRERLHNKAEIRRVKVDA